MAFSCWPMVVSALELMSKVLRAPSRLPLQTWMGSWKVQVSTGCPWLYFSFKLLFWKLNRHLLTKKELKTWRATQAQVQTWSLKIAKSCLRCSTAAVWHPIAARWHVSDAPFNGIHPGSFSQSSVAKVITKLTALGQNLGCVSSKAICPQAP